MLSVLVDAVDDNRNFVGVFMITLIKTNRVALRISQDNFALKNSVSGFQTRGTVEMKI